MNTKKQLKLLGQVSVLSISAMSGAVYASGGELWAGFAAMVCIAQDPANEMTEVGKMMLSMPQAQQAFTSMRKARECIVRQNVLSKGLCEVLLQDTAMSKSKINDLYQKHAGEIQALQGLNVCQTENK